MRRVLTLLVLASLVAACGDDADHIAVRPSSTSTTTTRDVQSRDCSAAGMSASSQDGLPPAVAERRKEILTAAAECDIDALANIDDPNVSFGREVDPKVFWRNAESNGEQPLRRLVAVLDLPYAIAANGDYVWPAAFARPSWDAVTHDERGALRALYDDEALSAFARFGSYYGLRVGISPGGTWQFFVAGD